MAFLQVRNMDDKLYEPLKRRTTVNRRSVSQQGVEAVPCCLPSLSSANTCPDDGVLNLVGTWADDRSADEIVANLRTRRLKRTQRFLEMF